MSAMVFIFAKHTCTYVSLVSIHTTDKNDTGSSTGSRKNYVNKIQDPMDPSTKCQPRIQDPSRSRILDLTAPGSRIFLGSWHMSG